MRWGWGEGKRGDVDVCGFKAEENGKRKRGRVGVVGFL